MRCDDMSIIPNQYNPAACLRLQFSTGMIVIGNDNNHAVDFSQNGKSFQRVIRGVLYVLVAKPFGKM